MKVSFYYQRLKQENIIGKCIGDLNILELMKDIIIYLIRHAETVDENGIRNTNENSQIINEKEILSAHGEHLLVY